MIKWIVFYSLMFLEPCQCDDPNIVEKVEFTHQFSEGAFYKKCEKKIYVEYSLPFRDSAQAFEYADFIMKDSNYYDISVKKNKLKKD